MATCSNCGTPLGDDRRKSQCGLCKDQRVPEPVVYCGKKCAQAHWKKEHKAWHEERAALLDRDNAEFRKQREDAALAQALIDDHSNDEDKFIAAMGTAHKALLRRDFREAVKQSRKAIALRPKDPNGYDMLARAFHNSGDITNEVTNWLKKMELCKEGTAYHARVGDGPWVETVCAAYRIQPSRSLRARPRGQLGPVTFVS